MKATLRIISLAFIALGCANESKDSVAAAKSVNTARQQKADSTGAYSPDAETADFLVKAANCSMADAKLAELAVQRTNQVKVKEMAHIMASDHGEVLKLIETLATQRNLSLPAELSAEKQRQLDELTVKATKDFDKAYIKQMLKDHEQAIKLFEKARDKVKDADVRTFANNSIPKLQMHLDSFKAVQKMLK